MLFNLNPIDELNKIVTTNEIFIRMKLPKNLGTKKNPENIKYQMYNQFCVCIIRIRETVSYINNFRFRKNNEAGQAFDFYEFINCLSIIHGCIETLFEIFDKKLNESYKFEKAFKISNKKNTSDLEFFKFVRSASNVHPTNTTRHSNNTEYRFEVYPYAIWIGKKDYFFEFQKKPKEADISLVSWNCKSNSNYTRYYLVSSEFFDFLFNLLDVVEILIPVVNKIANDFKEKIRCKRLKSINSFTNEKDYCLYLRKRIFSNLPKEKYYDGGLLIASHLLMNNLIGSDFKEYVREKIKNIVKEMKQDITMIKANELFDELSLCNILSVEHVSYLEEKFYIDFKREVEKEIESNIIEILNHSLKDYEEDYEYSDYEWILTLLIKCNDNDINELISKATTYVDLYELVLELTYIKTMKP